MTNLEKHADLIKAFPTEKTNCCIHNIRTKNSPCQSLTCSQCWEDSVDWLMEEVKEEE